MIFDNNTPLIRLQDIQLKDKENFDNFLAAVQNQQWITASSILSNSNLTNKEVNADAINGIAKIITFLQNQGINSDFNKEKIIVSSIPPSNPISGQVYFQLNQDNNNNKKITIKSYNGSDWDILFPQIVEGENVANILAIVDGNIVEFVADNLSFPNCYRRIVDDEWEWFNPPLNNYGTSIHDGMEYRTIKRFGNKPVYQRIYYATDYNSTTYPYVYWRSKANNSFSNYNIISSTFLSYGINNEWTNNQSYYDSATQQYYDDYIEIATAYGNWFLYYYIPSSLQKNGYILIEYTK